MTLDSVQCTACGYMMESISALPPDVQELIEYKEWSIKNKAGIDKFTALKGRVLPSGILRAKGFVRIHHRMHLFSHVVTQTEIRSVETRKSLQR